MQDEWNKKWPKVELPEDMDIHEIPDIENAYQGAPLYANFEAGDWLFLELRLQVHMLLIAFKRDIDNPEYQNVHLKSFSFYYEAFYGDKLEVTMFGQDSVEKVIDLVSDTVNFDSSEGLMQPVFDEQVDLEIFVKLTYAARTARNQVVGSGVDTVAKYKQCWHAGNGGHFDEA